jgi:Rps23 Pro-64 3,4-dihydroxylase Tpa1-like proline 4-hydroxylase
MIAKMYLDPDTVKELRKTFEKEGSVHLTQFFEKETYEMLLRMMKKAYYQRVYEPLRCSYGVQSFHQKALQQALHEFLCTLLHVKHPLPEMKMYSFGHRDYTVLQDDVFEKKGILVQFDVTPHWKEEFGGSTYLIDKEQDFLRVLPLANSLVVMKTDSTMKRFVKYVNHTATNRRRLFLEWFYLDKQENTH